VSKTVYGSWAKHTKGVNIEATLKEISKAIESFVSEVIPMWERMHGTSLSVDDAKKIIDDATKEKIISKRRADSVDTESCKNVWDVYTSVVNEVVTLTTKNSSEERAFDRNSNVGDYFRKLVSSGRMDDLVEKKE